MGFLFFRAGGWVGIVVVVIFISGLVIGIETRKHEDCPLPPGSFLNNAPMPGWRKQPQTLPPPPAELPLTPQPLSPPPIPR